MSNRCRPCRTNPVGSCSAERGSQRQRAPREREGTKANHLMTARPWDAPLRRNLTITEGCCTRNDGSARRSLTGPVFRWVLHKKHAAVRMGHHKPLFRHVVSIGSRIAPVRIVPSAGANRVTQATPGAQSREGSWLNPARVATLWPPMSRARMNSAASADAPGFKRPEIRQPQICRLRLAPASGISALPEMWPSG
jgi:hypothetical protein